MNGFWEGFEKQANMLARGMVRVRRAGRALSNAGLEAATNPTSGAVKGMLGRAGHSVGNAIANNPGKALGAAAGAAGLAGIGMSGRSKKDSNE